MYLFAVSSGVAGRGGGGGRPPHEAESMEWEKIVDKCIPYFHKNLVFRAQHISNSSAK